MIGRIEQKENYKEKRRETETRSDDDKVRKREGRK